MPMPVRVLILLALLPALAWLGAVALLALTQTSAVFPRPAAPAGIALPPGAVDLSLTADSGDTLRGHLIPGTGGAAGQPALVLGFGGNGWDARATLLYLHQAFPGHDVAAFHYRGYPPSSGAPSAAALQADALLIHDRLAVAGDRPVVAVGISLGAGVAAHLAGARPINGVILLTAFDSLTEVARGALPWAPVGLLFRHPMDPVTDLARSTAPVALISASHDRVIPAARTRALRDSLPRGRLVLDRTVQGDHDSIHHRPETRQALRSALAAMVD